MFGQINLQVGLETNHAPLNHLTWAKKMQFGQLWLELINYIVFLLNEEIFLDG